MYLTQEANNLNSGGASTSGTVPGSTGVAQRGQQGKGKKQQFFQYQSPLVKVQPPVTQQRFVQVAPPMPQYPGNFPGDPGFRPPVPPPLASPVQPLPTPQGQGQGLGSKKGKNKDNMDATETKGNSKLP